MAKQSRQDDESLGLVELIQRLRHDIKVGQEHDALTGDVPLFDIAGGEIEVNFTVERTGGGWAGIAIHIVSIGGKGTYKDQQVHKLKLSLTPHDPAKPGSIVFAPGEATPRPPRESAG